jgi:hypothetical protein
MNNQNDENLSEIDSRNNLLPTPTDSESPSSRKWFDTIYIPRIQVQAFLQLAENIRGETGCSCSFGERRKGGLNVAITLRFDDGVEWIVKMPKVVNEASQERLGCEVSTLIFLEKGGSNLTPRVHDYSVTAQNVFGTPYILMDKLPGVTLGQAIAEGLGRTGVYRTLDGLATFRKWLQQHPFERCGSIYLTSTNSGDSGSSVKQRPSEAEYCVAELNNVWSARLHPQRYRRYWGLDSTGYYFAQHLLSLSSESIYGDRDEQKTKSLIHFNLGLVLPCYIIESSIFFLAHTDLSISNVLVDPSDGTLLGIIDWEFANTLPPQAVEHYPVFLADRTEYMEYFEGIFDDPDAELDDWRAHYNEQFTAQSDIEFNNRIDAIFDFEFLLRHPNERSLTDIADALESLRAANALSEPLPDLSWLAHLRQKSPPNPTNIKPTAVIPSYGPPTPASTPPLSLNPPVTPTRNTSTPPRSSPLRNEIRTCDSYTTEEGPDPATEGIEREMTNPFELKENEPISHLSIFQKRRIHSVSTDASSAQTTISTMFDSEGSRPESVSSVGTDYLTTFQEVAGKSESHQIDTEIPTPNSVGQRNLVIALEVSSADISHDSFPHDMVDDTNSNVQSTDAKTPQIHSEAEREKSGQANPLIEVAEPAAEPSHDVLSSTINGERTNIEDLSITKGRSVDSEMQTDISITKTTTREDILGLMDVKEEVSKEECPEGSKEKASQQVSAPPTPTSDTEPGSGEGGSVSETRNPRFYRAALGGCFNVYRRCRKVFARKERPSG